MPAKDPKYCFVVSQIGGDDSPERIHADWFLEAIVQPAFATRNEFKVERADKLTYPGLIDAQVIHKLLTAEIVVADLTGLNPNVFYEIGIRHMAQKPIIHMHEIGQAIPFDVSLYRSISYSRLRPRDLQQARSSLAEAIESVLQPGYQVENPVTNVRGRFQLEQHATPEQKVLIGQLRAIEQRLTTIERAGRSSLPVEPLRIPTPPDPNYLSPYREGDYVQHHKFGAGPIVLVDGMKLTVDFPGGQKRIIDSFVEPFDGSAGEKGN